MKYFLLFTCLLTTKLSARELVDRLLASVDNTPILHSEIQAKIKRGQPVAVTEYPAEPSDPVELRSLQDEINFALIMQIVDQYELSISEEELDAEIDRFLQQRRLTKAGLMEALYQQGTSYEAYRDDFRNQLLMQKFQGRVIRPRIKVTSRDVEQAYLNEAGKDLSLKLVLRRLSLSGENKSAKAKQIMADFSNGTQFSELVKQHSTIDSDKANGGLMAEMALNDFAPQIQDVVKNLQQGDVSKPVELAGSLYLFYVEKRSLGLPADYEQVAQRLERQLYTVELMRQTKRWIDEQRQKVSIKLIAEQ